ncbi:hypothetical protein PR048_004838 [Dryococelus australis]|uniref:Retroviral polymerase SH3-like domain-containing protein n=1 Tax=Dryococelus australis TaxID=614101 RepID=A0ABQ9I6J5_9NEOP|nr:hypothetical protein PR048_004838 [Dryococelus australis]
MQDHLLKWFIMGGNKPMTTPFDPGIDLEADGSEETATLVKDKKLQSRAEECILLGFQEGLKAYSLWNLNREKIIVSKDVVFKEDVFSFKDSISRTNEMHEEHEILNVEAEDGIFNLGEEIQEELSEKNPDELTEQVRNGVRDPCVETGEEDNISESDTSY